MLSAKRRLYYLVTQGKIDLPCEDFGVDCEEGCETKSDTVGREL